MNCTGVRAGTVAFKSTVVAKDKRDGDSLSIVQRSPGLLVESARHRDSACRHYLHVELKLGASPAWALIWSCLLRGGAAAVRKATLNGLKEIDLELQRRDLFLQHVSFCPRNLPPPVPCMAGLGMHGLMDNIIVVHASCRRICRGAAKWIWSAIEKACSR